MPKIFVRSAYNYDMLAASDEVATRNDEPSLTRQADAEEADINVIMRRFGVTGRLPEVQMPPSYQQFAEVFDFQTAANVIRAAQESFNALDAETRLRFANDPARFVDFCQDPENLPDLRKMGLAVPEPPAKVEPEPMKVQVVNPSSTTT